MGCVACGRGFHKECLKKCSRCHPEPFTTTVGSIEEEEETNESNGISGDSPRVPKKTNLKDPKSTGRKRAAKLYPLMRDEDCEWRGKKNCGGGFRPVIGCASGKQEHRHHGPVKNPTRNELGNVHRICDDCHVHWHELNDLIYDEAQFNLLPHLPVDASEEEIASNYIDWKLGKMGERFELASSKNREKANQRKLERELDGDE